MSSDLERHFDTLLAQLAPDLPEPEHEHRFAPPRRWRFDRCWPDRMLAVELEGGTWTNGRHNRGAGFVNDCTKMNAATTAGWRVLRYTRTHLEVDPAGCIEQVVKLWRETT